MKDLSGRKIIYIKKLQEESFYAINIGKQILDLHVSLWERVSTLMFLVVRRKYMSPFYDTGNRIWHLRMNNSDYTLPFVSSFFPQKTRKAA